MVPKFSVGFAIEGLSVARAAVLHGHFLTMGFVEVSGYYRKSRGYMVYNHSVNNIPEEVDANYARTLALAVVCQYYGGTLVPRGVTLPIDTQEIYIP